MREDAGMHLEPGVCGALLPWLAVGPAAVPCFSLGMHQAPCLPRRELLRVAERPQERQLGREALLQDKKMPKVYGQRKRAGRCTCTLLVFCFTRTARRGTGLHTRGCFRGSVQSRRSKCQCSRVCPETVLFPDYSCAGGSLVLLRKDRLCTCMYVSYAIYYLSIHGQFEL